MNSCTNHRAEIVVYAPHGEVLGRFLPRCDGSFVCITKDGDPEEIGFHNGQVMKADAVLRALLGVAALAKPWLECTAVRDGMAVTLGHVLDIGQLADLMGTNNDWVRACLQTTVLVVAVGTPA